MNSLLQQYRPKDTTKENWEQTWENSTYLMQPLADIIRLIIKDLSEVKEMDFDTPNHYAKLMFHEGQKKSLKRVLDLLPSSVNKAL